MNDPEPAPMPSASAALSLDGLCYQVDDKLILQHLTLNLQARRIGVVGRNGSGKSTLARLIAGLIVPTQGAVQLNGIDLGRDRKAALTEVGILFQNPDHQIIFPTVAEEIAFGLRQQGQSRQAAHMATCRVLEQFNKSHWADSHISNLSQGQKHLVCLMAVMAMRPRSIILDEPFTGLDIPTKAQLIRYLAQYDGALIHITHDPADIAGYDQVIWLERGQVEQSGEAAKVLDAYTERMTALGALDDISDLAN